MCFLVDLDAKYPGLWWALSIIISCGTIAGALIPEFTKVFTSTKSRHVTGSCRCMPVTAAHLSISSPDLLQVISQHSGKVS